MSDLAQVPHIFRAYDIRGAVADEVTPENVERIGRAYSTYMRRTYDVSQIVVGRDNRPSSDALRDALIAGARAVGVSVTDIGLAPSPLLYYAAAAAGIDGGVSVTASHSPSHMNGLKLLERAGIPLGPDEIQAVYRLALANDFDTGQGSLAQHDPIPEYLALLERRFRLHTVPGGPLCVIVDPGNGVATLTGPAALERIGCEVEGINLESDGTFPAHLPDPQEAETMTALCTAVERRRADFGIAWDGDGDRVGVVDEQGRRRTPDEVLTLFARDLLARYPRTSILVDVKTSLAAIRDIEARGGNVVFSPSGHSLAKRKMRDEGILLGGEAAAHYYFAEHYYGLDDGVYGACIVARMLARAVSPLSALLADLPQFHTSPEIKCPCSDQEKFRVAAAVADQFRDHYPLLEIDGARIDFHDASGDGWGLVRASNTGPVLTVRWEAQTRDRYDTLRTLLLDSLRAFPEVTIPAESGALPS